MREPDPVWRVRGTIARCRDMNMAAAGWLFEFDVGERAVVMVGVVVVVVVVVVPIAAPDLREFFRVGLACSPTDAHGFSARKAHPRLPHEQEDRQEFEDGRTHWSDAKGTGSLYLTADLRVRQQAPVAVRSEGVLRHF